MDFRSKMIKNFILLFVILMAPAMTKFLPAGNGSSGKYGGRAPGEVLPNMVVVKFKEQLNLGESISASEIAALDKLLSQTGVNRLEQVLPPNRVKKVTEKSLELQKIYIARFGGERSPFSVAEELRQSSHLEYAEPLYNHHLFINPDDPSFSQQNYLNVIKAPLAWDTVKGETGNTVIAIVDGGTEINHADINENLWVNPGEIAGNGLDDDGNGYIDDVNGWNFANNTGNPTGLSHTPLNANHGTHTAGIACAVTNNQVGVAGVSWNARLMAINSGSTTYDNSIPYGYQGIIYAAENGADIINLSWGRSGGRSAFEQEVIEYAASLDVVIVAAAGNSNSSGLHFPSSYNHVVSVAATDSKDIRASFSNYGSTVDISAPGVSVYNTVSGGSYSSLSGTSMASPVIAGVVGLVKTLHPEWLNVQAAEQVRATADDLNSTNSSYIDLLGKGRVNAQRAVTEITPSIRLAGFSFIDSGNDGIIHPEETVQITVKIKNFLAGASNVQLSLEESSSYITLQNAGTAISAINTLEEQELTNVFSFSVASNAPSGHPVEFKLKMQSGNYQDLDRFVLTILPTSGNVAVNNIATTVTNIGRIGFGDANNQDNGIGFSFMGGPNLLFEGALIMGTGDTRISNAARGVGPAFDLDFLIARDGDLQIIQPGAKSDEESIGAFNDSAATNPMNVHIVQETFAMASPPYDDFILFKYTVENLAATNLNNFHFGLFFDWDMDGENYATNVVDWDASHTLGYVYDTGNGPSTYVGVTPLTSGTVHYRAIFNDQNEVEPPNWGLYDGYTDAEKWESISGGVKYITAGPSDISQVMALGPFNISSGEFIELGFAILAGEDLADLQANADSAKSLWQQLGVTGIEMDERAGFPQQFQLSQNYPNPFNPATTIRYSIPLSHHGESVRLEIFNALGQKVRTLVDGKQAAGYHKIQWDGRNDAGKSLSSGLYFYRLTAGSFIYTKKMILMR